MSMLAMTTPSPHSGFTREYPWDGGRHNDYGTPPRREAEKIALPSIHQAFPEIRLRAHSQDMGNRASASTTSPAHVAPGAMTPPEYIHSPSSSKRRRLSEELEYEGERASRIPRLYENPVNLPQRHTPPPAPAVRVAMDGWGSQHRASPYAAPAPMGPIRSAGAPPAQDHHSEHRPSLPSLPHMAGYERQRGHSVEDFAPARNQPMAPASQVNDPTHSYRTGAAYPYTYHHPSRAQSLSVGSIQQLDRTPFSNASYGHHYPEFIRIGEMGGHGESKQRKRRGNLPKETTDKLRAWFVAHLQHPYPTEDEKQELMRQTGLQMNQISNWFINARRRQLPTMINNARAESDAMAGSRSGSTAGDPTKILPSTERGDFANSDVNDMAKARSSVPLSEGEASYHEEELEALNQRRTTHIQRGSI